MARYKNVEFVVDGFIRFIKDRKIEDLYLLVIGQNRELDFRELILSKYGDNRNIILLDYLPDEELGQIYNAAFGFIYLSLYEGFGLPILEAMKCSVPVICSNVSSMPEVAGDGAIQIDPRSLSEYWSSLDLLLSSESARLKYIDAGTTQSSRFSWDKYVSDVISAYNEME